jgi:NTP pyrophosphatase (non-canonical NTP hydrolase)
MRIDDYQELAGRTLNAGLTDAEHRHDLAMVGLGVAGEAGEVADLLKKHLFHGHALDRGRVIEELGDVLWYCAALASLLHVPLSDVASTNVAKLKRRYPDGFSEQASRERGTAKELPTIPYDQFLALHVGPKVGDEE